MKTIAVNAVTAADLASAIAVYRNAANCTIYYNGDSLPSIPITEQEKLVAARRLTDIAEARIHVKLKALMAMTPAQVQNWVAANVTNLTQAQDAIATLAIAISILARRI